VGQVAQTPVPQLQLLLDAEGRLVDVACWKAGLGVDVLHPVARVLRGLSEDLAAVGDVARVAVALKTSVSA
jgi:hypothetical protein